VPERVTENAKTPHDNLKPVPQKSLQSERRVSCDLAHVSVTAVKLKNVYVQCVTFNYRYFLCIRVYAYTELCLQARNIIHLSEHITI